MSLDSLGSKSGRLFTSYLSFSLGEEFGKCEHLLPCRLFPWMLALCFPKPSAESGVVIAGGERLFDFPSLQGGKFWPARPEEARARKRLGLAEIIGLTPRLQTENEAVTAIRGMRVKGKRQSY